MVMYRGVGGGVNALLLSFRGIVNWLGCFDVVVMKGGGGRPTMEAARRIHQRVIVLVRPTR